MLKVIRLQLQLMEPFKAFFNFNLAVFQSATTLTPRVEVAITPI